MLAVAGLSKSFSGNVIFRDVTFSLAAGEAVALVGPNGAGKTTLLRCVVGSERPDEGQVLLSGKVFTDTDPQVRADVACALDDADFFPDLSLAEHLDVIAWSHGAADAQSIVDEVLTELDLYEARDQLPGTLSSGQRRRLTLAACLVRPRKLLVLDEPEQRLDAAGREWLAVRLKAEKADGTAVLIASHDAILLDAVADRRIEFS